MVTCVSIIVQMRGPSPLKNGILSIGLKNNMKCTRISFEKTKTKFKNQIWDDKYKKRWDISYTDKAILSKIEMEAYDPIVGCKKIREYFDMYQFVNIYAHPEDISAISSYLDYHLDVPGFFRDKKFVHHSYTDDFNYTQSVCLVDDLFL